MSVHYYDETRGHYITIFADKVYFTEKLACIQVRPYHTIVIKRCHMLEVRAV